MLRLRFLASPLHIKESYGSSFHFHCLAEIGPQDLYRIPKRREYFIKLHEDLLAKKISTEDASERLQTIMQGYRSSNDHPISSTPAETVAAFPDAKYILSVRDGGRDAWWKSYNNAVGIHFRRGWDRTIFRTLISSVTFLRRIDDGVQVHGDRYTQQYGKDWFGPQLYGLHNEKVKSLLPKDKLLIYNVKQGWGPLCKYLGVPVPAQPFPFLNEQEAMKKIYFGMQAYGAFCWLLYGILAALPVHLAFHPSIVGSLLARLNARASLLLQSVR